MYTNRLFQEKPKWQTATERNSQPHLYLDNWIFEFCCNNKLHPPEGQKLKSRPLPLTDTILIGTVNGHLYKYSIWICLSDLSHLA